MQGHTAPGVLLAQRQLTAAPWRLSSVRARQSTCVVVEPTQHVAYQGICLGGAVGPTPALIDSQLQRCPPAEDDGRALLKPWARCCWQAQLRRCRSAPSRGSRPLFRRQLGKLSEPACVLPQRQHGLVRTEACHQCSADERCKLDCDCRSSLNQGCNISCCCAQVCCMYDSSAGCRWS